MQLHKELNTEEEIDFRQWARDNYRGFNSPNGEINSVWHPIVKEECERMRNEYTTGIKLRLSGLTASEAEHEVKKIRSSYND